MAECNGKIDVSRAYGRRKPDYRDCPHYTEHELFHSGGAAWRISCAKQGHCLEGRKDAFCREDIRDMLSKKEKLDALKELGTPIDFDKLIAEGILKKSGTWFIVLKPKELPEHARQQVSATETGPRGQSKVKFKDTSQSAKALYKRITGKNMSEE